MHFCLSVSVGFLSHVNRIAHVCMTFSAMPESGLPPLLLQLVLIILKSVAVITRSIIQKLIKLFNKPKESCRGPGIAFPCCLLENQNTKLWICIEYKQHSWSIKTVKHNRCWESRKPSRSCQKNQHYHQEKEKKHHS